MKMRFEFPQLPSSAPQKRGAAPVGVLHELPNTELAAIVYLRAWCEGGTDKDIIEKDFQRVMGEGKGMAAVADFDALMISLLSNARRPIMRHSLGCACFGGDEGAFANMVAAAAAHDRDDAMLFASTLVTGHATYAVIHLAERLGQVFLRLARLPNDTQVQAPGTANSKYKH